MAEEAITEDEFSDAVDPFVNEDEFADAVDPFEQAPAEQPAPTAQYNLMNVDDIRKNRDSDGRALADATGNANEVYSQDALMWFFKDQYVRTEQTPNSTLEMGRVIYNDNNLGMQEIYSKVQQDIATGEIKQRLDNAEWLQYGFTDKVAGKLNELNNSAFIENMSHSGKAMGEGLIKAVGGMYAGTASLILPEAAEKAIGLDKTREFLGNIDEFRQERIMQDFEEGDMVGFIGKSLTSMGGDMYGNLFVMKQGLKVANSLLGGNLSIVQKDRIWKEMAKNTALKASVFSAMTFAKTDGTLEERTKASALTFAYMATPALSSALGSNAQAIVADIALNSGITALTGQYEGMIEKAKAEAEAMGNADSWGAIFAADLIQVAGPDVVFGAMTRSSRGLRRADSRAKTVESARLLKPTSDQGLDRFKSAMEGKYGKGWIGNMDDVDRMAYESRRAANAALTKGEMPEQLQQVQKDFSPRVVVPEAGRIEIEGDKKVWRDSKGVLRGTDGRIEQSQGDGKYILTPENTKGGEKLPTFEAPEPLQTAREQIDIALKSFEDVGVGGKPAMPQAVKEPTVEKGSVSVNPPDPAIKDTVGWQEAQITYISKLMRNGEIKTKADYEAILDTYPQRDGVDPSQVFKEARAATKQVKGAIAEAEKKSAKGKITQAQFKKEQDMVLVNSMNIIKDRIKATQEGVKLGKKIGAEVEKARANKREGKLKAEMINYKLNVKERDANLKSIVSEAGKIVDAVTKDQDVKNRFKVRASKLRSEKALDKFVTDLTEFVAGNRDATERMVLEGKITKSIPESVDARYAESIQDLQDMINTDTGTKSAWRLDQQRNLLERNPDVKLPEKILKKLQQTNISEISTEELRGISTEIKRLTDQGKLALKTKKAQAKREVQSSVSKIMETSKKPKTEGPKIKTGAKEMRKFAGLRYVFGTGALRPWNLVDKLDGGKAKYNGEAFKKLIDEPNESYSTYLRMSDSRLRAGEGFIRGIGMRAKDLNMKHKIGDQKLTTDELLSVYASSKNRLMHNSVLHGNFKGDADLYKQAVDIVSSNQKLKALGDYIVYDYATNYDRVRRAYIANENKILGQEENYVPMVRFGLEDKAKSMSDIAGDLAGRADNVKKLPDNKFTIDRVNVPDEMQSPVKLGLYNQWEKSVNEQERYINMFGSVKKMDSILRDKGLREQVRGAHGEDFVKALDSYSEAYANPMSIYDTTSFSKYSRNMRKRTAAGFLAYNFVTMSKQVPSLMLYMGQGGAKNMLLSLDDFNSSWNMKDGKLQNDLIKFVEEKDPQVKHAHLERELQELKTTDRTAYDKVVGKLTDKGMVGIAALDKAVRTTGWYSVYLNSLQAGKSDAQAVADARNATMRTQPTASAKDLPDLYKQGEVANWFLMFSNQLNQLWNLGTYQFPKNVKNDPAAAVGVATGLAINALAMYTINNHQIPQNEDDVAEMFQDSALASIPLFGSAVVGATKGYDTGNPLLASINKSTKKVFAAIENGEDIEDTLPDLIRNLTPVHGIPVGPLKRLVDGEPFGKGKKKK